MVRDTSDGLPRTQSDIESMRLHAVVTCALCCDENLYNSRYRPTWKIVSWCSLCQKWWQANRGTCVALSMGDITRKSGKRLRWFSTYGS